MPDSLLLWIWISSSLFGLAASGFAFLDARRDVFAIDPSTEPARRYAELARQRSRTHLIAAGLFGKGLALGVFVLLEVDTGRTLEALVWGALAANVLLALLVTLEARTGATVRTMLTRRRGPDDQ